MMTDDKYGAYAEYTVSRKCQSILQQGDRFDVSIHPLTSSQVVPAWTTFPLGPSTSFEEAATLPLAVMTACFGLYQKLNLPETVAPGTTPPIVVINGASSSVGSFAAQLAKISGIKTVGVAGSGGDYAKKCGIDVVVDYRGKSSHELSEAIKEAVKSLGSGSETGECHLVFDCVAENGSVEMLSEVISGKGIITVVLPSKLGSSDESGSLQTPWTAVGAAHESETKDWAAGWYRKLGKWLEEGKFKGNEVKLMPGGLEGVKEGLELLKGGKVHGQKLVYRLAETQGLQSKI